MTTKERLLLFLEEKSGEFVSGEEIAEAMELSRTAVWKAVKALRADGYEIDAAQNKGYRLSESTDILSQQGILRYLDPKWKQIQPEVHAAAESTNALLRERANAFAPEGTVILANAQSKGRGRLGRSFYSPPDTGIYMSLLLRPVGCSPAESVKVTTMAAVAASRAIETVSGCETKIKWVNDIYLKGKKVCGILTEGAFSIENGSLEYIVLGVGINVYAPSEGFPDNLAAIAGSVFEEQRNDGKNRLAALFLNYFMEYYHADDPLGYAESYRAKSMVIGKRIRVITPSGERIATALDVDGECRLIVRFEDGSVVPLSSAEVSIYPE